MGLGLLLQECWRIVKVETDDNDILGFLQALVLGVQAANKVVPVIKKVLGHLAMEKQRLGDGLRAGFLLT